MAKTRVEKKRKPLKSNEKLKKSLLRKKSKKAMKKPKKQKKVRFAKHVEENEITDHSEGCGDENDFIDDESDEFVLNGEMDDDLSDSEKEFLDFTREGKSYPIVKDGADSDESVDDESEDDNFDYNETIESLKEKDPDFYEFLLKHDRELIELGAEDAGDQVNEDQDEDADDGDENEDDNRILQIDSSKVNLKFIDKLSDNLREKHDKQSILNAINLFKMAIAGTEEDASKLQKAEILNSIIHLCLIDLLPAIHKFLRLPPPTSKKSDTVDIDPTKSKNWRKIALPLKAYSTTLLKTFEVISEPSVIVTLLRHCLHMIPFFRSYVHLEKRLLKKAIEFWSEGEEKVRVLAFLIVLRIMRNQDSEMLSYVMKKLYMSFIKNCKFTSVRNWPSIIFMRQSLVELYSLDHGVAYNHAFVFIRQCAISLRNALMAKKKEANKAVFNWCFVHSLLLWSQMLTCLHPSDVLKPLIHPLVQVMIGSIRLLPVAKNLPFRFHMIKGLITLSESTNTFIPILPFIAESLEVLALEKKMKPSKNNKKCDLECILKVSKPQTYQKDFIDACINKIYDLLLDYCSSQSHSISFPELVFIATVRIKHFIKKCKVPSYCRLMKQALDKIEENAKLIEAQRRKTSFAITDTQAINEWEQELKQKGTPITKFYTQWKNLRLENEKKKLNETEFGNDAESDASE